MALIASTLRMRDLKRCWLAAQTALERANGLRVTISLSIASPNSTTAANRPIAPRSGCTRTIARMKIGVHGRSNIAVQAEPPKKERRPPMSRHACAAAADRRAGPTAPLRQEPGLAGDHRARRRYGRASRGAGPRGLCARPDATMTIKVSITSVSMLRLERT